jgi:two-component system, NtrC family, sensor histidine kinase GlrK
MFSNVLKCYSYDKYIETCSVGSYSDALIVLRLGLLNLRCLELKNPMRVAIFWRIILAQSALIVLALVLGLYAFTELNRLIRLDTSILTIDTTCINDEKRLLKIFLAEMRNAEKYLISRDSAFYTGFVQSSEDFAGTLATISALVDTQREKELTQEIWDLQSRYSDEFNLAATILTSVKKGSPEPPKSDVGEGILERINQLIRIREQTVEGKTAAARDHAVTASNVMFWLTLGGIAGALLLAYFHARGVSLPLRKLADEMHRVGKGKFARSLDSNASKEVSELVHAFNRMSRELEELDRLKADFTAHISHELRTPLTAIREGTALLLEGIPGPLTSSQREILDVVRSHSERLFLSISSILDLSKMEAEMMEYELTPTDATALIYRSIDNVKLVARKKGIDLQASVADGLPLLFLDERRIQQVLDNLLSNALKFAPEGGKVNVAARLHKNSNGTASHVEVVVSDTGQGIPEDDLEKVFKRFYQSAGNTGKKEPGTGLGLAIAHHIVEAHKGYIWVESTVGEGSRFIFTLPVTSQGGEVPPAVRNKYA